MTLPATVGSGLGWPDHKLGRVGPFENGTNLYAVLRDTTNNHVEVWKSTDSGNSWAEVDSANHKSLSTTAGQHTFDVVKVSTTLYIAYITTTPTVVYVPFDLSTDTWGTVSTSSGIPTVDNTGNVALSIARRSDGNIFILTVGIFTSMATDYRTAELRRWSGAAWSSTQLTAANTINYNSRGCVLGASDRIHCFWVPTSTVVARTFLSTNTAAAEATLDSAIKATATYGMAHPIAYDVSGTTRIGYAYVDADLGLDFGYAASVDQLLAGLTTFAAVSATSTSNPEEVSANPGSFAEKSDKIYSFWPDDTTLDIYRDDDQATGTWQTDTEWKDAVACAGISIGAITINSGDVGVLYDDGGTIKYDQYPAAGGGPTPQRRRSIMMVGD